MVLATLGSSPLVGNKHGVGEPTVIALHGWGRSGSDFDRILAGTTALAVHLPGFGSAVAPPKAWSPGEYAEHLASALVGHGQVHLVGHSFGGRVAIRLAARYPHLVRSLLLTGVPLIKRTPAARTPAAFRLAKKARSWGILSESRMEILRNRYGSADYRNAEGVMRGVLVAAIGEDYFADAAKINVPVTMVWGELDQPAPVAGAQKALEYFPHATLRVVPSAFHLLEGSLERELTLALHDALST
jgi:pimeloyl-ACP methyl ester carboxylesterase